MWGAFFIHPCHTFGIYGMQRIYGIYRMCPQTIYKNTWQAVPALPMPCPHHHSWSRLQTTFVVSSCFSLLTLINLEVGPEPFENGLQEAFSYTASCASLIVPPALHSSLFLVFISLASLILTFCSMCLPSEGTACQGGFPHKRLNCSSQVMS